MYTAAFSIHESNVMQVTKFAINTTHEVNYHYIIQILSKRLRRSICVCVCVTILHFCLRYYICVFLPIQIYCYLHGDIKISFHLRFQTCVFSKSITCFFYFEYTLYEFNAPSPFVKHVRTPLCVHTCVRACVRACARANV